MEKEDGSYDGGKGWSDACGDDIGGEEWNGSGAKRAVPDKWNRSYSRCFWCLFSVLDISNRRKNGLKWAFVSIEFRKNTYFNCAFTPCFAPESDLQN